MPELRYVSDDMPGIRRLARGGRFVYRDPQGKPIRDEAELARIRKLAIPPAYRDVWICPDPLGHLQATGRDARGRKQYRYHPAWREARDAHKYGRMIAFGQALPRIRARIAADLALPGLPRERVIAALVRLLDTAFIRIGNVEYARENGSFGLTTLRNRHVAVWGDRIAFQFRGKSGVEHQLTVQDPRVARIVKRCRDIPGHELFQYLDEEGQRHSIGSADVNAYLREVAQADFSAKDYRTWAGSVLALAELGNAPWESERQARQRIVEAVRCVAARLGNTPATCRKCYVHPAVLEQYLAGILKAPPARRAGLRADEARLLALLQRAERAARIQAKVKTKAKASSKAVRAPRAAGRAHGMQAANALRTAA
jgi:DNA topoisomerase-1